MEDAHNQQTAVEVNLVVHENKLDVGKRIALDVDVIRHKGTQSANLAKRQGRCAQQPSASHQPGPGQAGQARARDIIPHQPSRHRGDPSSQEGLTLLCFST